MPEPSFQQILDGTLQAIRALPTIVPAAGRLAGFRNFQSPAAQLLNRYDNFHYSMGDAFYRYGVSGIAAKAAGNVSPDKPAAANELLRGIASTYREVAAYFSRYGRAAAEAAHRAPAAEQSRLQAIADNLNCLAARPPQSFEQALQLFYLMWSIRGMNRCSCIGRLDVRLKPFYEQDKQAGRIDAETVFALICELWEHLNGWGSGDTLMNVMVGGSNPDGSDASSDLSKLMLEASIAVGKTEPHLNVRCHRQIRPDVLEAACRLQYLGHGQATMYNDDAILPAMRRAGIPEAIAADYANDGCTEIIWDGHGRIDFNHIDAVAALELTLYNGRPAPNPRREEVKYFHAANPKGPYTPEVVTGFASGDAGQFTTYEEFYQAFLRQYRFQLHCKLEELREYDRQRRAGQWHGLPFLNGTYEAVLTSGVDLLDDGLPMNSYMVFTGSLPTVADGLAALKRVVYEQKHYTIAQLKAALEADFDGAETMRRELLAAPKFGNDLDEVDCIAAGLVKTICDDFDSYRRDTGFTVFPALIGWRFVEEAYGIGATPDGRKYKEPIAEHYCATPGRLQKGVTALINSIAKAPLARAIGVAATHISLPRNFAAGPEEGVALLKSLNESCFQKGLTQFNIAIYDAEQLRDAQRHPERHRDLIVRVWGFSAKFVELSEEMQQHIIQRVMPR